MCTIIIKAHLPYCTLCGEFDALRSFRRYDVSGQVPLARQASAPSARRFAILVQVIVLVI
ncbi:hypothetical protein CBM2633_P30033 [Cupriavidus taiwanensis]|uniref:Uncharacterized protein n=3 Tax=Cupriavidus TaxID=106589 RepID=A0A375HX71_9BURK|nr:hypothetical protein pRALTA_0045 [Cupriavidus taiwanensis LMG 19424]SOZ40603.1 hypothetical protein CBM2605_P30033 [Cupriavidus neocaledonicus]SPA21764.1 hypothetical protein CBM2631_P40028 [Cupriavidus taiwanensis]SPA23373.1 hypothetical protein CBM2633_P30033 [Cupriavidus taiwanensis]SPA35353.1 hypothetical protein CBM2637_P30032 [Cupriavidus taiwanensis]